MESFRSHLQQEYLRRNRINSNYSLRSFARSLGLHHGTLSQILSGRRKISQKTFNHLAAQLNLSPTERTQMSGTRNENNSYLALQKDAFSLMSEWYFDAILELCRIPHSTLSPKTITKKLGISAVKAKLALQILLRLELLEKTNKGYRLLTPDTTNILDPDTTTGAQNRYQTSILEKSKEAIESVSIQKRDHTSLTLAIAEKDVPKAKELIKKFRREFDRLLGTSTPDQVFQLHIGFFPLTNEDKGNRE